ncbi:AT hook motif-containing, putative [Babesia ovis]|uniref:AT hook motif-containing, putative n=1 Tax=Babesia ovis TaxID=5869 RepID=A0A9W5T9F9_BABOV|nr:AT hook motif-containing, putative [Babesia ovis]
MDDTTTSPISSQERNSNALDMTQNEVSGDLYSTTYDDVTPQMRCNDVEPFMDSFYDDIVNPMYNFESPYMVQNYANNRIAGRRNSSNGDTTKYTEDVAPYLANQKFRPDAYTSRDVRYYPSYGYEGYPLNTTYNNLCQGGLHHVQQTSKIGLYPPNYNVQAMADCDMNTTTLQENPETPKCPPKSEPKSDSNRSTAPSVVSESSPVVQPEATVVTPDSRVTYYNSQMYIPGNSCLPPVPMSFRNSYNEEYFGYNIPTDGGDDCYNQTYVDTSSHEGTKQLVQWCSTLKDDFYGPCMHSPNANEANVSTPRRLPMMTQSFVAPQNQYPGRVLYCANNWLPKPYVCDNESQSSCCSIPKSAGYYENGAEYVPLKTEAYPEPGSNVHEIHPEQPVKHGSMPHISGTYETTYEQSHSSEYFYNQPNGLTPQPNQGTISEEYIKDVVEDQGGVPDAINAELCMESLKNLNRNNIDFLRMSESVWQALRSTGMFKLGNKGRAVLKSKISKQLKMNPHLRMRALGISGVRRATTRQLFQLAQICGIKSHLK